MNTLTAAQISQDFAEALTTKFDEAVTAVADRNFDRIVLTNDAGARTLLGYVKHDTGELIEAESWVSPKVEAGHLAVRFLIATTAGFNAAVEAANVEGDFLTIH